MELDDQDFTTAITDLENAGYKRTKAFTKRVDFDEEYNRLVEYLCLSFGVEGEEDLLEYMEERGINFWGPLPNESAAYYEHFMLYLQLPSNLRTPSNTARVKDAATNSIPVLDSKARPIDIKYRLFWEVRAELFDESYMTSLSNALHDTQKHRINAMRARSLTIASLGSDIATEMLIGLAGSVREIDYSSLSPNQIAKLLSTATSLANESSVLAEKSLMLSEILETLQELEEIDEELLEEKRFVAAEVVD